MLRGFSASSFRVIINRAWIRLWLREIPVSLEVSLKRFHPVAFFLSICSQSSFQLGFYKNFSRSLCTFRDFIKLFPICFQSFSEILSKFLQISKEFLLVNLPGKLSNKFTRDFCEIPAVLPKSFARFPLDSLTELDRKISWDVSNKFHNSSLNFHINIFSRNYFQNIYPICMFQFSQIFFRSSRDSPN